MRFLLAAALCLTVCAVAAAQTPAARPDRGVGPSGTYSVTDVENVNLTNGNLNLSIPLAALPPVAGGKLSLTLRAEYNSKAWDAVRFEHLLDPTNQNSKYTTSSLQLSGVSGWTVGGVYSISFQDAHDDYDWIDPPPNDPEYTDLTQNRWAKVVLTTPDGATHELRPVDYTTYQDPNLKHNYLRGYYKEHPDTVGAAMRYYSFDGSHLWAKIDPGSPIPGDALSWTVVLPDGAEVVQSGGVQRIIDTNGNKVKIWSDVVGSVTTTHYQDELTGREIRYVLDSAGNGGQGLGQAQYQTVNGVWETIDVNFGATHVFGKRYEYGDPNCGDASDFVNQTITVVRSIVFPQTEPGQPRRQFTFSYNSDQTDSTSFQWHSQSCEPYQTQTSASHGWGSLSQMVTPSGATVNYSYALDGTHYLTTNPDDAPREGLVSKAVTHDGTTDTWQYTAGQLGGSVNAPDGTFTTETMYPHDPAFAHSFAGFGGKEGLVYRTNNSDKVLVERHWTLMPFAGAETVAPGANVQVAFNPVVDAEYTTLMEPGTGGQPVAVRMSAKTFGYDYNGNLTQETDYDWFDPGLVSRDAQGVPTGVPAGATMLKATSSSYYNGAESNSSANVYAKRAVATFAPLILNAAQETTAGASDTRLSYDNQAFGVAPSVGNLTSVSRFDNQGDADPSNDRWVTTSATYDAYGNKATSTDADNRVTSFFYLDSTHAMPTKVEVDPLSGTGPQDAYTSYDFSTGLMTSTTDVNGQTSTIDYTNLLLGSVDPLGRPAVITGPLVTANGVSQHHKTFTTYEDHLLRVTVESDLNAEGDRLLKGRTTTDQLGRPVLAEKSEDGSTYTISAQTAYEQMGKVTYVSSPMRAAPATTDSWTRMTKDAAGRVVEAATFSGAQRPAAATACTAQTGCTGTVTTQYYAEFVTVADQTQRLRRSRTDALGRLVRVDEPDKSSGALDDGGGNPAQPTAYSYDVLGNLTTVRQGGVLQNGVYTGGQTRSFTYSSLSRLASAINPEACQQQQSQCVPVPTTYVYDPAGNLLVKTDPRGVSAHYEYDGLNRVARRWYNGSNSLAATTNNSPTLPAGVGASDEVKYFYDTQALPPDAPASFDRGYAAGRLVATTYGGGSAGTYVGYDSVGKPVSSVQQTGGVNYPVSSVTYNLAGAMTSETYPSGNVVTTSYDQAGRVSGVAGSLGDGATRTYASGVSYTASGALQQERFGTDMPLYHKLLYNSRGQLAEIRVGTAALPDTGWQRGAVINQYSSSGWGATSNGPDNNGNLREQDLFIPQIDGPGYDQGGNWTGYAQSFTYDSLNRLSSASESGASSWSQSYAYDRYGNRTISAATNAPAPQFTVDTATNRLGVPSGQAGAMSYDAAGNLTNDTYQGGQGGGGTRAYDAENRVTTAQFVSGQPQTAAYTYDADGRRVKRNMGAGGEVWQVYGLGGELLAEYAANGSPNFPQKEYGYRGGELLVTAAAASTGGTQGGGAITNGFVTGMALGAERSDGPGWTGMKITTGGQNVTVSHLGRLCSTANSLSHELRIIRANDNQVIASTTVSMSGCTVGQFKYAQLPSPVTLTANIDYLIVSFEAGGDRFHDWFNTTLATTSVATVRNGVYTTDGGQTWGPAGGTGNSYVPLDFEYQTPAPPPVVTNDFVTEMALGAERSDGPGWTGMKITTGSQPVTVSSLGRLCSTSNSLSHELRIIRASDNQVIASTTVSMSGCTVNQFKYAQLSSPVTLSANTDYLIVSFEAGGDHFHDWFNTVLTTTSVATVKNGVYTTDGGQTWGPAGGTGNSYVPVGFQYTTPVPPPVVTNGFVTGMALGAERSDSPGWTGMKITIGGQSITVSSLGRLCSTANSLSHELRIIRASDNQVVASATVSMSGCTVNQFKYAQLSSPVTLAAGADYLVVSFESGGDHFHDWFNTTLTTTSVAAVRNGVYTTDGGQTWGPAGGTGNSYVPVDFKYQQVGAGDVEWLVADQLGTPRMIIDHTGGLVGVKRHDYLPFGEEILANRLPQQLPQDWRTGATGYGAVDNVRQKFTHKERDAETGLDYFLARYYSSAQGRFTSTDEFKGGPREVGMLGSGDPKKQALVYADITNPQSLNKYQYSFNNPLRFVDPNGQDPQDSAEINMNRDIKELMEGKITVEEYNARQNARGVGALIGAGFVVLWEAGPEAITSLLTWMAANPDKVEEAAAGIQEALGGPPGTLTISATTRLSKQEIMTGERLAKQAYMGLVESGHVGEEYYAIVNGVRKTYDAMGGPRAYQNFGSGSAFFRSILRHVNKSVDYVAIDLKGASKDQIRGIQTFVRENLTKAQQKKIIYVSP